MSSWTIKPTEAQEQERSDIRQDRIERYCRPSANEPRWPDPGRCHRHHRRYGFRLVSRRRQSQYDNHWSVVWTILGTYEGDTPEESIRALLSDAIINGEPAAAAAVARACREGNLSDWFDGRVGELVRQRE